jgi:hypothetical protein
MQMQSIGHGLWVSGNFKRQDSGWSEHDCYIGYQKATGPRSTKVVPIIKLATLTNDSYLIKVEKEVLVVSKKSSNEELMRIDIKLLKIPENLAEQVDTEQPASRLESKSEGSGNPQPRAEGLDR